MERNTVYKFLSRQIAEKTLYEADKNITVSPETALAFWPAIIFLFVVGATYIYSGSNDEWEMLNKIIKNNKRNYEYRLSISIIVKGVDAQSAQHRPVWSAVEVIPDNPSLSVNNMPLLRDKDGLLKERGFLFLAGWHRFAVPAEHCR